MMCVCAAGTGAAIVPAAHVVKRHLAPHRAAVRHVRTPFSDVATVRPDCLPGVTAAGGGLGGGGGGGLTSLGAPTLGAPASGSNGFPFGGFSGAPDNNGGGGGGAGPGDSGPGGPPSGIPSGPGTPGMPGAPLAPNEPLGPGAPSISNAPEPASWVLMVAGFGLAGGAVRYRRTSLACRWKLSATFTNSKS